MRETPTILRCFGIVGCILLLAAFYGCTGLPDYALPHSGAAMADPAMLDEAFTYRQLTRSDFRAPALPADQAAHASAINAHTCARIRPTKDSRFTVVRTRYNDSVVYIGSIEKIRFAGIMIPGCSWWNPALPAGRHAYVLQHEQIHFALVELAARRLTADIREEARSFMTIQPTQEAARTEIAATVNQWIRSAMEASLETHTAFDNDTSLFYSPGWQQWWQDKVEKQLAAEADPANEK
ncbi:hypothetical protein [uncultured Desulfosarcina sp.]|uniref:hypothetical protein n=1 Tax=uncultured Desulfosarcina sp. TaxID=218289 RepID=UPI0029C69922|nr:hypothetical protein [uncultured Desulfosarcina sp.]